MTDLERFRAVMSFQPVDRCVYGVWTGGWPETYERWKGEGWTPGTPPPYPGDRWEMQGGWFFPDPPFQRRVLEQDAETVLYVNHEGITMRERKDNPMSSMPQFVRFPFDIFHLFPLGIDSPFGPGIEGVEPFQDLQSLGVKHFAKIRFFLLEKGHSNLPF